MCIYIYSLNYIQIYSMSNRPCEHQKSLQLDVHPLNDGRRFWLHSSPHRGPQHRPRCGGNGFAGTLPWLFGWWDDNWSSSRAAADQVGAPSTWQRCSKGSIIPCTGRTRGSYGGTAVLPGTVQKRTSRMWTRRQRRSTTAEVKNRILSIRMSSQYSLSRYICQANLSIVYSNSLILPE